MLEHIEAQSFHARRGAIQNAFRYRVDFVLTNFSDTQDLRLFSRNARNLWSLWDKNHGGPRSSGRGLDWFRETLRKHGAPFKDGDLFLLAQPSWLGFWFNPVSFWLWIDAGQLRAFVAEVNNTVGQRHCYFCAHPDFQPINPGETICADKQMYVSPFQDLRGDYQFKLAVTENVVDIRISYTRGDEGVFATLRGRRKIATDRSLAAAAIMRPFGAARVVMLIHWQAAKLFFKRAPFRRKSRAPKLISTNRDYHTQ